MRVPRALELPAVILTTAVLTFTGVSALQAAVNPPLAELAEKREAKLLPVDPDAADSSANEVNLRALLSHEDSRVPMPAVADSPAAPATAPQAEGSTVETAALAQTGAPAAVPAPVAPAAPATSGVAPAAPAQPAVAPPPAAPRPASTPRPPTPAPAHVPVSGMDYVWDQTFGSGSFQKPGTSAGTTNGNGKGNGKTGVGQVCPPGQAKKGNC